MLQQETDDSAKGKVNEVYEKEAMAFRISVP